MSAIEFRLVPMRKEYAQEVFAWRYEPPYDFYDPSGDRAGFVEAFLNPEYHYYAVLDSDGTLIAYRCFGEDARVLGGDYTADAMDMGGGLRRGSRILRAFVSQF